MVICGEGGDGDGDATNVVMRECEREAGEMGGKIEWNAWLLSSG